jgi:tetratricopeptide (TPR) repeat protein
MLAAGGLALAFATAASASRLVVPNDPAQIYVAARAAAINGDHGEAAQMLAQIAGTSGAVASQAVSEAIRAGDYELALKLISQSPEASKTVQARLLLIADALRHEQIGLAEQWLKSPGGDVDLSFWVPMAQAWGAADRGDRGGAMAALAVVPKDSAFSPFVDEESALILLKFGRTADAEPLADRAIAAAGARETRLRLAFAAGFQKAGDRQRALTMIQGMDDSAKRIAELNSGRLRSMLIDTAAKAFSEQLLGLAIEMKRSNGMAGDPFNIVQIARFASPDNSDATILAGLLLSERGETDQSLSLLRSIPATDPFADEAMDAEAKALIDGKRFPEALALAQAAVRSSSATADDYSRLGDVLSSMKRYDDAAGAYQQALARSANASPGETWPTLLLLASSLESARRWPEAKEVLDKAITIAPNQPLILNFLGYADLEHGEDVKTAEALIVKASSLDPNDASITDSLGWALYKQGRIEDAIDTLQKAAAGDPAQSEIQEHLGDALYTAGYRFEARYAWRAALITADEDAQARLKAKIASGLTQMTAAR